MLGLLPNLTSDERKQLVYQLTKVTPRSPQDASEV
jgi:hypothetical protein